MFIVATWTTCSPWREICNQCRHNSSFVKCWNLVSNLEIQINLVFTFGILWSPQWINSNANEIYIYIYMYTYVYTNIFNFYWSIVYLKCLSFRCTSKWISNTYTYICIYTYTFLKFIFPYRSLQSRSYKVLSRISCAAASWGALVVKNPPANAGDITDTALIPGLAKSPGGGHSIQ